MLALGSLTKSYSRLNPLNPHSSPANGLPQASEPDKHSQATGFQRCLVHGPHGYGSKPRGTVWSWRMFTLQYVWQIIVLAWFYHPVERYPSNGCASAGGATWSILPFNSLWGPCPLAGELRCHSLETPIAGAFHGSKMEAPTLKASKIPFVLVILHHIPLVYQISSLPRWYLPPYQASHRERALRLALIRHGHKAPPQVTENGASTGGSIPKIAKNHPIMLTYF